MDDTSKIDINAKPSRSLQSDEEIRTRAYALWHQQGQPEGKDQEHWLQAEQEHEGHESQPLMANTPYAD